MDFTHIVCLCVVSSALGIVLVDAQDGGLFPVVFNLATDAYITTNATCGENGQEMYCKLVDHVLKKLRMENIHCGVCDLSQSHPSLNHDIKYAIDGSNYWWQSPSITQGFRYHYVTIDLDLRQIYTVAYVIVKAANSPRPGNWILERSVDGRTYKPWQYFAISDSECFNQFGIPPTIGKPKHKNDSDVICTSFYSRLDPLENGEIHISLVNGRPGVDGPSRELIEFTSARYIRLRFQRIRTLNADLMTLQTNAPGEMDMIVMRRYFYSIKDISVGGQCICFGHAEVCPRGQGDNVKCKCEHNTCGDSCETCCPMFNQHRWRSGTKTDPGICEECNCNGHAESCVFNQTIADLNMSMNKQGVFNGGGVCLDCQDNTEGINCQTCKGGYFRPSNLPPDVPNPCQQCQCDSVGTTRACVRDSSRVREQLFPGDCICKPGYAGSKCSRCAAGFTGYPNCEPCPCRRAGSINVDTCQGDCMCKNNVEGEECDRCKPGYYNLDENNPNGCSPCFCFGVTEMCHSVKWGRYQIALLDNWYISDTVSKNVSDPTYTSAELIFNSEDRGRVGTPAYWTAPQEYLGNKLISYGGYVNYSVYYEVDKNETPGSYLADTDILLQGNNGLTIGHGGSYRRAGETHMLSVQLLEKNWQHINLTAGYWGSEATKRDFMAILHKLEKVQIRASYHTKQSISKLSNVRFDAVGETVLNPEGQTLMTVEQCGCPPGYSGLSCETCVTGYRRVDDRLYNGECRRCDCHGHADMCDSETGICKDCKNNTDGLRCEVCKLGFYGDATRGKKSDCKECACPLNITSNNFAQQCMATNPGEYTCLNCQPGYTGPHCETCEDGFFGNPNVPGNYCQSCDCSGNVDPNVVGNCNKTTGECLKCIFNTKGFNCQQCFDGFYGNPLKQECRACECNQYGSVNATCDEIDGRCSCKANFTGRQCDKCVIGMGDIKVGCRDCACNLTGSKSSICDPVTGLCTCKEGVTGVNCEKCAPGYYGYSDDGCKPCKCSLIGSFGIDCNQENGTCRCRPNVVGEKCDSPKAGFFWSNDTDGGDGGGDNNNNGGNNNGTSGGGKDGNGGNNSGGGAKSCDCDPIGSTSPACNPNSGQCPCKPGVTGRTCNKCKQDYWGLDTSGCKPCDVCDVPGTVCDAANGKCKCPPNTVGAKCEDCAPFTFGHDAYEGCKPCNCEIGSISRDCDEMTGNCPCKMEFSGKKCNKCSFGYINYPMCKSCTCDLAGTLETECSNGLCQCNATGQCPCKENVVRKKCNKCKEGTTFSLDPTNPRGCTECFCFGRTEECEQAPYVWTRLLGMERNVTFTPNSDSVFAIDPRRDLLVIPPGADSAYVNSTKPLYWSLVGDFRGDKLLSYNGKLRFTVYYEKSQRRGVLSTPSPRHGVPGGDNIPLVQIVGNYRIYLEYYDSTPLVEGQDNVFEVKLREENWYDLNTRHPVSREMLMVALQNVQSLLIRAAPSAESIRFVSVKRIGLDYAVSGENATGPNATGVEMCKCPPQYVGSSCQDPAEGFFREKGDDFLKDPDPKNLIGDAKPCDCFNHTTICDKETGDCFNCSNNAIGDRCQFCDDGYYGNASFGPGACLKCECPLADPNNNFSPKCIATKDNPASGEYVCFECPVGYDGAKCEKCSNGFFGNPMQPGNTCQQCSCNDMGSYNTTCDATGQCPCKPGITGKKCDECEDRFAVMNGTCKSCDEGCTQDLMVTLDEMEAEAAQTDVTVAAVVPWQRLYTMENMTKYLKEKQEKARLDAINTLRQDIGPAKMMLSDSQIKIAESQAKSNTSRSDARNLKDQVIDLIVKNNDTHKHVKDFVTRVHDQLTNKTRLLSEDRMSKLITRAEGILNSIKKRNFKRTEKKVTKEKQFAMDLLNQVNNFLSPTSRHNLTDLYSRLDTLNAKLNDLPRYINESLARLERADEQNRNSRKMIDILKSQNKDITDLFEELDMMIEKSMKMDMNASSVCRETVPQKMEMFMIKKEELGTAMLDIENATGLLGQNLPRVEPIVRNATRHAKDLQLLASRYEGVFNSSRLLSADAVKAATVYENIVDAIGESKAAGNKATMAGERAIEVAKTKSGELIDVEASKIKIDSMNLKTKAQAEKDKAEAMEVKLRNMSIPLDQTDRTQLDVRHKKSSLDKSISMLNKSREAIVEKIKVANETINKANDVAIPTLVDIMAARDKIDNTLAPKLEEIKNKTESIFDIPNIIDESVYNTIRAKNFTVALNNQKNAINVKNDDIQASLLSLRDKIRLARQQANTIRVSLKCAGGCVRTYKPDTEPGTMNTISYNFKTNISEAYAMMLYIEQGPQPSDFLTLYLKRGRVRMAWNAGGGPRVLENKMDILPERNFDKEADRWYRIEAQRAGNVGQLTVKRIASGDSQTVTASSFPYYTRLDINRLTPLYVGGIPPTVQMPNTEIEPSSFVGCISELEFDGGRIGLHNFLETTNHKSCDGCIESPAELPPAGTYQFLGYGFSEMPQVQRYTNKKLFVLMQFKTVWNQGLVFLSVNKKNKDFFSIEIVDGRVVFQYQLSGTTRARIESVQRYNVDKWVQINAARNGLQGRLQVGEEIISGVAGPGTDIGLELLNSSLYFGGVPDSLNKILEELNVTSTKYLGCMREVQVSSRSLISQNILTGNYYGINPGCVVSARMSGFYSDGYLELPPQEMSRDSDLSFSFVTMEPEGLIFLSRGEFEGDEHHVSISVIDGYVDARFNAGRGGVSIRSSKQYNDELVHSVTIIKARRLLDLVIDDEKVGNARLPRGPTKIALGDETKDGIFIGGVAKGTERYNASEVFPTDKGFFGCVFNLVINGKLIYMDNNKGFINADIGRCAVNHKEANLTANIVASPTNLPDSSFTIDPDPTEAVVTEPPSKCAKSIEYKEVPRGFSFGSVADSHGEIMLEPSILAGDFDITLDFRTFQPYGLMFYFMSVDQSEYLAMQLNNGKITLSYTPNPGFHDSVSTNIWYDDGLWHLLQLTKAGKKLAMALDGGSEFSANFQGGMNLEPKMYIGGLPESVVTGDVIIRTSFPGCLRNIKLLSIPLSLDSPGAIQKDVGTCYLQVEQGSYFSTGAYGIIAKNYFVGQEYNVRMDFRTNRLNGVLLSISSPKGFPALALEVIDGRVKFTAKTKHGNYHAISNELQNLCDNKWHNIIAELIKNVVTIQIDHTQTEIGIETGTSRQLETDSSMYLGGFPSSALPQGATHSNDTFVGCMKNLFINGRRVDMYKIPESNGINRANCPV